MFLCFNINWSNTKDKNGNVNIILIIDSYLYFLTLFD